jgi:DNA-binding ferritin-like protein
MDVGKAERVVEALNLDLAATLVLSHQLRKHHWTVGGVGHRGLVQFFREAADDMLFVADDLADRIHALGGVPISGPAALERHSPIPFEGADVYDGRTALSNDLQACGDLIEQVSSHVELAESYGDHATGELLRFHLVVVEEYAHVLNRFLREDSQTTPS